MLGTINTRQYTPLLRAWSKFSVCNLHQHRVIYELRGYSSNGVESGGGERRGETRGSQFQLHTHSSPLAVERLRNYLQPFTLHALSAVSPLFYVEGVSNQLPISALSVSLPPPPPPRSYFVAFHFRPVLSRILPSLQICNFTKSH